MHAFAVGNLEDAGDDILVLVQDDVVGSVCLCHGGLLRRTRRPDDDATASLDELRKVQSDSTCDGVYEDVISRLDGVYLVDECERSNACWRNSFNTGAEQDKSRTTDLV